MSTDRKPVVEALSRLLDDSYTAFGRLTGIQEEEGGPTATQMIGNLTQDQATLAETAEQVRKAAAAAGDEASVDLAVTRISVHEKNAWMLRSHLD